jgi:hypothetical protein
MSLVKKSLPGIVLRYAARLRFPTLFLLTAVLFTVNLFVPDTIPFVDEILLGLVTILLGSLRQKRPADEIATAKSRVEAGSK